MIVGHPCFFIEGVVFLEYCIDISLLSSLWKIPFRFVTNGEHIVVNTSRFM